VPVRPRYQRRDGNPLRLGQEMAFGAGYPLGVGIYRDAVRSSKSFFVKTSGLRWVSMMLLTPIPWAKRVWALPFLTVLAPSERYHHQRGKRHKTLPDHARQMIKQLRRWLPERMLVVVADSTYAVIELLAACGSLPQAVTVVTRLRLDAALYDPAPVRTPPHAATSAFCIWRSSLSSRPRTATFCASRFWPTAARRPQ